MEKAFHQQKAEDRKRDPPDLAQDGINLGHQQGRLIGGGSWKLQIVGCDHAFFQDHSSDVVDEHGNKGNPFQCPGGKEGRQQGGTGRAGVDRFHRRAPFISFAKAFSL